MSNKKELTEIKDWVVIDREGKMHEFEDFYSALQSKVKGSVMTRYYYDFHYSKLI